jgi:Bacterial sugar transferase
MGLVLAVGAFVGALLIGVLGEVLSDECKAWLPWIAERLIRRAVNSLPQNQRVRYNEEWRSHVDEVPGAIGKVLVASSLLRAGWRMSRIVGKPNEQGFGKIIAAISRIEGLMVFVLILPLFALISLLVRLTSPGSVFCSEKRVCVTGRVFHQLRFRTEREGRDGQVVTTAVGRFIGRARLDSLPIILNVLRGDVVLDDLRPGPRNR